MADTSLQTNGFDHKKKLLAPEVTLHTLPTIPLYPFKNGGGR